MSLDALDAARRKKPEMKAGLVSLKRTKSEKKVESSPSLAIGERDDYDYGLKINLHKESLEKLGLDSLPKVGTKMRLEAEVEVVSVSSSAGKGSESRSMDLQITHMKLEDGAGEDE